MVGCNDELRKLRRRKGKNRDRVFAQPKVVRTNGLGPDAYLILDDRSQSANATIIHLP